MFEVVQIAELHQAVPIVVVGDIDPVIFGSRVLHPGPLMAPIAVMPHRRVYGPEGALTARLSACGEPGVQLWQSLAGPAPEQSLGMLSGSYQMSYLPDVLFVNFFSPS